MNSRTTKRLLPPGWLTDFALTDDVAVETVDWTEYVLTRAAPGPQVISCCPGPGWRGAWLPLPDISVEDDTIVASGTAQIDDSLEGTMRYRTLPDAPVMKLTLAITNTGESDFEGSFHYNVDPDSLPSAIPDWDVAIVPGVGTNPGFIDEGWTANYVYDGPTDSRDDHPAHGIAWLDDEPIALSAHGRIFGAWFDASTPAGATTEISWYHVTDYPAEGADVTANIGRWAAELDLLDDEVEARPRASGVVRDEAESPVAGARVMLRGDDGAVVAETRTCEDGSYAFPVGPGGVEPGTYEVVAWIRVYLPSRASITVDAGGGDADVGITAITEPVAGVSDVPPDVNPSVTHAASVAPNTRRHLTTTLRTTAHR